MTDANGTGAEQVGSTVHADNDPAGRAGGILSELVEATRSAAEALLDEQKRHAATQVRGLADAVRCAAEHLDQSETWGIGRYADRAAGQIEQLARLIGEQKLAEIVAETRHFARRQPWLFICIATTAGFVAGRVLSASTNRGAGDRELCSAREAAEEVTAAVASGDGKLAGQHADITARWETH